MSKTFAGAKDDNVEIEFVDAVMDEVETSQFKDVFTKFQETIESKQGRLLEDAKEVDDSAEREQDVQKEAQSSKDPEGLRCLYYLVQDLKCMVFSLINLHMKIKPI